MVNKAGVFGNRPPPPDPAAVCTNKPDEQHVSWKTPHLKKAKELCDKDFC